MVNTPLVKDTSKADKVVGVIKSGFGWFGLMLIAGAYLAFSFITVGEKEATFWEIASRIAVSFFVGFSINRMLEIQGLNTGLSNPDVMEVGKVHYQSSKQLGKDRKKLQSYCKYINRQTLKDARETILAFVGLDYDGYFDEKGKFIGKYEKVSKTQDKLEKQVAKNKNKNIKWAIKHRVTQVTPATLLSDDVKMLDANYLGQTISQFTTVSVSKDIIAKLAPAFIVGRIAVEFASGADWASFIMVCVELTLYVLMGFIKYYNGYNFVTIKYKQRLINKTVLLDGLKEWEEPKEVVVNVEESRRTVATTEESSRAIETVATPTISNAI